MDARIRSKVTPKYETKYRVKNWAAYEVALRKRGDVTLWFDEEAIGAWHAPAIGHPGGQRRYSDLAIVTALTLRAVFALPPQAGGGFRRIFGPGDGPGSRVCGPYDALASWGYD